MGLAYMATVSVERFLVFFLIFIADQVISIIKDNCFTELCCFLPNISMSTLPPLQQCWGKEVFNHHTMSPPLKPGLGASLAAAPASIMLLLTSWHELMMHNVSRLVALISLFALATTKLGAKPVIHLQKLCRTSKLRCVCQVYLRCVLIVSPLSLFTPASLFT